MAFGFQVGILFRGMVFESAVLLLAGIVGDVYPVETVELSHSRLLSLLHTICCTPSPLFTPTLGFCGGILASRAEMFRYYLRLLPRFW